MCQYCINKKYHPNCCCNTEQESNFPEYTLGGLSVNNILGLLKDGEVVSTVDLSSLVYDTFDTDFASKTTDDLSEGVTNLYFTNTRTRAALSGTAPISYDSGTGVISLPQSTNSVDGYLSSVDWTTFNSKQDAININTARLMGRFSAGSGTFEEITLGSGLSLSGGGELTASASGVSIGDPVGSSTVNSVLFVDGSNQLAEDNSNFSFSSGGLTISNVVSAIGGHQLARWRSNNGLTTTVSTTLEIGRGIGGVNDNTLNRGVYIGDTLFTLKDTSFRNVALGYNIGLLMTGGGQCVLVGDSLMNNLAATSLTGGIGNFVHHLGTDSWNGLNTDTVLHAYGLGHNVFNNATHALDAAGVGRLTGENRTGTMTRVLALGFRALYSVATNATNLTDVTALGPEAGKDATGSDCTYIGFRAGEGTSTNFMTYISGTGNSGTEQRIFTANTAQTGGDYVQANLPLYYRPRFIDRSGGVAIPDDVSATVYTNLNVVAAMTATLPANPTVGDHHTFIVRNAFNLRVEGAGTQVIYDPNTNQTSVAGGYIESDVVGSSVTVMYVASDRWEILNIQGPWTVDSTTVALGLTFSAISANSISTASNLISLPSGVDMEIQDSAGDTFTYWQETTGALGLGDVNPGSVTATGMTFGRGLTIRSLADASGVFLRTDDNANYGANFFTDNGAVYIDSRFGFGGGDIIFRVGASGTAREVMRIDPSNDSVEIVGAGGAFIEADNAATNTVTDVLDIASTTSGVAAAGIGVGMKFRTETSAGNEENIARIEAVTTDVTSTSEDADVVIETMQGGATPDEAARFPSYNGIISAGRIQGAKGADVASANDITLGYGGNLFDITGTTTINTISATDWQVGSIVLLQFDSGPITIAHLTAGTGAQIDLKAGVNVNRNAGDTLQIIYDGTNWKEFPT